MEQKIQRVALILLILILVSALVIKNKEVKVDDTENIWKGNNGIEFKE